MAIQEWSDTLLIAELSDEPLFSEEFDGLLKRFEDSEDAIKDVVIDLKSVTYLNSSNIAQLLRLRKMLAASKHRMRLCSVNDSVWSVFLVTGLDKLFNFTDDVSTSLASLQINA